MQLDETFMHFLLEHQRRNSRTLNFLILMESILTAARQIDYRYRAGALQDNLGEAGRTNVQGEKVMELDLMAHQIVMHYLNESNQVIEATSEEVESEIPLNKDGRYIVYFDPLDGSSNIKHSLPVGFLFGIVKRNLDGPENCQLRAGKDFIAAGMFLIPSGMFTFALRGAGTWRFLMDETGVYVRPARLYFPEDKQTWELSWNASNRDSFQPAVRDWLNENEANYNFRYAGSLVVDFHRLLHNGGMFCYPAIVNDPNPKRNRPDGKLRLLYEGSVVAFLAKEAGGMAINEDGEDILSVEPSERHQRTALYVGNTEVVRSIRSVLRTEAERRKG
jgi:fructose-1,6-bisphosphatase I